MKMIVKIAVPLIAGVFALSGCAQNSPTELSEKNLQKNIIATYEMYKFDEPTEISCPVPLQKIQGESVVCDVIQADGEEVEVEVVAQRVEGENIWVSVFIEGVA